MQALVFSTCDESGMLAEQTEQREIWQTQGQLYVCIGQVARDVQNVMIRGSGAERRA